eukprot:1353343-Amphidinium_carterae.1
MEPEALRSTDGRNFCQHVTPGGGSENSLALKQNLSFSYMDGIEDLREHKQARDRGLQMGADYPPVHLQAPCVSLALLVFVLGRYSPRSGSQDVRSTIIGILVLLHCSSGGHLDE